MSRINYSPLSSDSSSVAHLRHAVSNATVGKGCVEVARPLTLMLDAQATAILLTLYATAIPDGNLLSAPQYYGDALKQGVRAATAAAFRALLLGNDTSWKTLSAAAEKARKSQQHPGMVALSVGEPRIFEDARRAYPAKTKAKAPEKAPSAPEKAS